KVESADLFKDMLGWLGRQNLIDISRDDPSFDQTTFKDVDYYAKEYAWGDTIEGRKLANSVLRFLNQSGGKYNVMGKGDKAANLNVVFAAFDSMKDLPLVPRSTP
ncbi:hypothetical protein HY086_00830, partial [Candidatus Gottesmanbacteria bacterium]|nr:hypothetical protein [Candidatus Gottesmanbacteria bacterium]